MHFFIQSGHLFRTVLIYPAPDKRSNKKRLLNSTEASVNIANNTIIKKVTTNKHSKNREASPLFNSFIRYSNPKGSKQKYPVNNNPLKIVRICFAFSNTRPNFSKALPNVLPFNKGIKLKYMAKNSENGSDVLDMIYGI